MTKMQKEFLMGLTLLTKTTGIAIKGCGCCGSPYLEGDIKVDDHEYHYFEFINSNDKEGYIENLEWRKKEG